MLRRIFCWLPFVSFFARAQDATTSGSPRHGTSADDPYPDRKLPDGRSQREEILKSEYAKTLKDAAQLIELATEVKTEIEKETRNVLSIASMRKLEDIEHLAHRMRDRMRRF